MRPRSRPARVLGDLAQRSAWTTPGQRRSPGSPSDPQTYSRATSSWRCRGARPRGRLCRRGRGRRGRRRAHRRRRPRADRRAGLTVPVLVVRRAAGILGAVSAWLYGNPARRLTVVGVTGTNGKTTTCYFVDAALRAACTVPRDRRHGRAPGRRRGHREPADHRRGPRAARPVRPDARAGATACAHGGLLATRLRSTGSAGRLFDVVGVHQPAARPPRLPRRHGGLLRATRRACSRRTGPDAA